MAWKRLLVLLLVVTSMVALTGCACADDCEEYEGEEEEGEWGEDDEFDSVKQPTHSVSVNPDNPEPVHKA